METKQKKEGTKRLIFTILGVLLLIASVFTISFAVFIFEDTSNHYNSIETGTSDGNTNKKPSGNKSKPKPKPTPSGETIVFSYNEDSNGIELVNAIPIDDNVGKNLTNSDKAHGINQGYFDFSVKASGKSNKKVKYDVYATLENGSNMDNKYIKVYLTDDNNNPYEGYTDQIPVFDDLSQYGSDSKSKKLYSGSIIAKDTNVHKFRLRLWVAKDYSDASTSKTFKMKINVKATA